jgi:hypothetical protein
MNEGPKMDQNLQAARSEPINPKEFLSEMFSIPEDGHEDIIRLTGELHNVFIRAGYAGMPDSVKLNVVTLLFSDLLTSALAKIPIDSVENSFDPISEELGNVIYKIATELLFNADFSGGDAEVQAESQTAPLHA